MNSPSSQLKKLLADYQILSYLQGEKLKGLPPPKKVSDSLFSLFLVKKNDRQSILKVLKNNNFISRITKEATFYQIFNRCPTTKQFIVNLITYSFQTPAFIEIDYLKHYQTLGDLHQINKPPSKLVWEKILSALSQFHWNKVDLNRFKLADLPRVRNDVFYLTKLIKLDTGQRIKNYFAIDPKKIIQLINSNKEKLNNNYLTLGDRNPTNILIKDEKVKLIDFDRVGISNPGVDFTFLYLTLLPHPSLQSLLVDYLNHRYKNISHFWFHFWFDILMRSVDEYHFWFKINPARAQLIRKLFFASLLKLN